MSKSIKEQLQNFKRSSKKPTAKNGKKETIVGNNGDLFQLNRVVEVECLPLLGTVVFKNERKDIQQVLSNLRSMPQRLKAYLYKIGLLNKSDELTALGEQFLNKPYLETPERGLFNVWFATNDPFLKRQPICIQRVDAFASKSLNNYQKSNIVTDSLIGEQFLSTNLVTQTNSSFQKIDARIKGIEVLCKPIQTAQASLDWSVKMNKPLSLTAELSIEQVSNGKKGSISTKKEMALNIESSVAMFKSMMNAVANELEGRWDSKTDIFEVPFSDLIDNQQTLNDLRLKTLPFTKLNIAEYGEFNIKEYPAISIAPFSEDDAHNWLSAWCAHLYQSAYLPVAHAEKAQLSWLSKPELAHFDLAPMRSEKVLNLLGENGKTQSYWHAAAGMDILPNLSTEHGVQLTLEDGSILEVQKLLNHLTANRIVDSMMIADRYFTSESQKSLLETIANKLGTQKGLLVTLEAQFKQSLPSGWDKKFVSKSPENHDRYWIFFIKNEIRAWKVSASLDFARKTNTNELKVYGYPTFSPIQKDDLPSYLQEHIEAFSKELV